MAVPEQIRKQSEDIKKFYETGAEQPEAKDDEDTVETEVEATSEDQDDNESNSAVENAAPEADRDRVSKGGEDTFEHKYKTLQGMYNADIGRLQMANRQSEDRISQLEELIANLQSAPAQTQTQAPAQTVQKFITDDDVNEYGESIDVMRKVSKEELSPIMSKMAELEKTISNLATSLNSNVLPTVQNVARQQTQSATDNFWAELNRRVPNWQQINNDQDFQNWLLQLDPLTGQTRQTFLEAAQKALDVNRVVAFFDAFAPQTGQDAKTNGQPSRSASELEKQVAPGRSRGTSNAVDNNPKTYSPEEIRAFYNDVRAGKYKGREKERGRIEHDIFAAQREGRIVQTT